MLVTELDADWKHAFNTAYHQLKSTKVKLLLATYFGQLAENLHLAAIVLDVEMNVVGANDSGRRLIGNIGKIDPGTPIHDFVESRQERQTIEINGVSRLAHIILSTARDKGEGTMLICLE